MADTAGMTTIRLNLNPEVLTTLPLMIAVDEGFFAEQHLDIKVVLSSGTSATLVPSLARGDLDISNLTANPSFFNQVSQGFDAKLFAAGSEEHKGWNSTLWLVQRQEVWDAKSIRTPADLRGKHFDGGPPSGYINYTARAVLAAGHLTPNDLHFTERFVSPANWLASLRNVNEVQALYEPTVTQMELEGIGHRWISTADVMPNFQQGYIAASGAFLKNHPDEIRRFLTAYFRACAVINNARGKWTPEMVRILAKYSSMSPEMIRHIPTPPYFGEFGELNKPMLERVQHFWHTQGLVTSELPIDGVIDSSFIAAAQAAAGVRRSRDR